MEASYDTVGGAVNALRTAGPGRSLEPAPAVRLASGAEPARPAPRSPQGGRRRSPRRAEIPTGPRGHSTYDPGRPLDEVARQLGLDSIADLASNESPVEPLPEVMAAIAAAAARINRYPSTDARELVRDLAGLYDVDPEFVWVAPGSTALLASVALAATGPGTSVVFADPSFVMYRMATAIAGATPAGSAQPAVASRHRRHDRGGA